VYLSSGISYGDTEDVDLKETDPAAPSTLDPGTGLAHAKRAAEFLLASHAERTGGSLTVARCFTFSGPGMPLDLHYALGNFIRQARSGQDILILGDGQDVRSYMHLGDMALWLLTILTRVVEPQSKELFNVGSDKRITIQNLAALVAQRVNPTASIHILGAKKTNKSGHLNAAYIPSIQKARASLGLDVWTSLAESIDQMTRFANSSGT
jgi:dTDP-glucose 4,6-dehydratase/UDP-glucose 4-epimerase